MLLKMKGLGEIIRVEGGLFNMTFSKITSIDRLSRKVYHGVIHGEEVSLICLENGNSIDNIGRGVRFPATWFERIIKHKITINTRRSY